MSIESAAADLIECLRAAARYGDINDAITGSATTLRCLDPADQARVLVEIEILRAQERVAEMVEAAR